MKKVPIFKTIAVVAILLFSAWAGFAVVEHFSQEPAGRGTVTVPDLLAAQSERLVGKTGVHILSDIPENHLAALPAAVHYRSDTNTADCNPVVFGTGTSTQQFLAYYPGKMTEVGGKTSELKDSIDIAQHFWAKADGAFLIDPLYNSSAIAATLAPLASYTDLPIITEPEGKRLDKILGSLGVEWVIKVGDYKCSYGKERTFNDLENARNFTLEYMSERFGTIDYIVLTNTADRTNGCGITDASYLAPYFAALRKGTVFAVDQERLPDGLFEETFENEEDEARMVATANNMSVPIRQALHSYIRSFETWGLDEHYLMSSPYLAILGDPYSVPFHYVKEDIFYDNIATDNGYADLDGDMFVDLAIGRPIGLDLEDTAALISRTLFYDAYRENWLDRSPVADVKDGQWSTNAYVGKGDDWNGAIWSMTRNYYESLYFFESHGYEPYISKRHWNGATIAEDLLHFYTSSSYIYEMAHGSPYGYQMVDGVDSSDVRDWDMGPSILVMISCSVGRTDVPDIENTISLAFTHAGANAFVGGTRTEMTTSAVIVDNINQGVVVEGKSIGIAVRDAKNQYLKENGYENGFYDSAMKEIYGDPAFIPYIP